MSARSSGWRRSSVGAIAAAVVVAGGLPGTSLAATAYVVNSGSLDSDVSLIALGTNTNLQTDVPVGTRPSEIAITPDGSRAYVANSDPENDVSVIDLATNTNLGSDIQLGAGTDPRDIAITPNGSRAYVVNVDADNVAVIDVATNAVVTTIAVGDQPRGIAITPDGTRAYVSNRADDDVSVIDLTTNANLGIDIAVGTEPHGVAIRPDGARAYVMNEADGDVSVIDVAANSNLQSDIAVGLEPRDMEFRPGTSTAYVVNTGSDNVSVVNTATNMTVGPPIGVGNDPHSVVFKPDGSQAYVTNTFSNNVSVIDAATSANLGTDIAVGDEPKGIAIRFDQPPPPPPPPPAPSAAITSGPNGLTQDRTPTFTFSASEAGASFECSIDDGPFAPCSSPYTTPRLAGGPHTLRVRARSPDGSVGPEASVSFSVARSLQELTAADPPALGVDVNVAPVRGVVLVAIPGQAANRGRAAASQKGLRFVPLEEARQIPVGSFLDTTRGTVSLQSARNRRGQTQAGRFASGLFQVLQARSRRARGLTELRLKGSSFRRCRTVRRGRSAGASQVSRRTIRRLRSNANGRFQTRGRHSAATVRGTVWLTADRCDGTLTKVSRGRVAVRDFRRKRTITVRAGKSYLARAPG